MKKIKLTFLGLLLAAAAVHGQSQNVGIGTISPDASAQLDVSSNNKGFLPPRMTSAQRDAITNPAKGLIIYNTTLDCMETNAGAPSAPQWKCITLGAANNGAAILSEVLEGSASPGGASNANGINVTAAQLTNLGITGVVTANEAAYNAAILAATTFSNPPTTAEIQSLVNSVNSNVAAVLAQVGNEADNPAVTSTVTAAQLTSIGITGVAAANEDAYHTYIDANPGAFSNPATIAEVQSMVTTVNTATTGTLAQIGNEADDAGITSSVTIAQLSALGITGLNSSNIGAYHAYIDANPNAFSNPATLAEVQSMVTTVNSNVTSVLAQVGNEGDNPDVVNSVVTAAQLTSVGITGVTPANEGAYQEYIDTHPDQFSNPATVSEIQTMVTAVNNTVTSVLAQVGNEGDNPDVVNSVVTAAQLQSVGITGVTPANEGAYQEYIDTHPNAFSNPATLAEIQSMVTAVNNTVTSVLAQVGNEGDNPDVVNSVVTAAQLQSAGITGVTPANEGAYQDYIDTYPNAFSNPATLAEIQSMVTAVNSSATTSGGTATVSAFACNTASAGTMVAGQAVSGVTQTITATVTTAGTYAITATGNGVTFSGSGTFAGTGAQNITLTATGTPATPGSSSFSLSTTPGCSFTRAVNSPSSGGTAVVSAYSCSTASAGTMNIGTAVSGVTQTITATVTTAGTYDITTSANGVTFSGSGTFAGTGAQNIVLTASGTPNAAGTPSFTLSTTPACSFTRTITGNPYVTALSCGTATINRYLSSGFSSSGTTITLPYTGGNGVAYTTQTVSSTGVTGVTATLTAGTLASGAGNLVYTLSGTPSAAGTASFSFSFGGQTCSFSTTVYTGKVTNISNTTNPGLEYRIKVNASPSYYVGTWSNTAFNGERLALRNASDASTTWSFVNAGTNQYFIYNSNSGRVIDVSGGAVGNPVALKINDCLYNSTTGNAQLFQIYTISGVFENGGTGSIRTMLDANYGMDVYTGTFALDNFVNIYSYNGNPAQVFSGERVKTLTNGTPVSNFGVIYGYQGGNSGTYPAQTIASTGVTGLTATLAAGSFNNGSVFGFLRFSISGTPSGSGTATFPIFIGGQSFSLSLAVN